MLRPEHMRLAETDLVIALARPCHGPWHGQVNTELEDNICCVTAKQLHARREPLPVGFPVAHESHADTVVSCMDAAYITAIGWTRAAAANGLDAEHREVHCKMQGYQALHPPRRLWLPSSTDLRTKYPWLSRSLHVGLSLFLLTFVGEWWATKGVSPGRH